MSSCVQRFCALATLVALAIAVASPASASPETLKRSMGNILFAPLDLALSPVVAAHAVYTNLRDVDDSLGVKLAYPIPALVWNTGVQIGCAAIREITGLIEFVPGLGLLFFEADMTEMFAPVERGSALVDIETPPLRVKFGVNYTTAPY